MKYQGLGCVHVLSEVNCEKWIVCNFRGYFLGILRNCELSTFHFPVAVHVLSNSE